MRFTEWVYIENGGEPEIMTDKTYQTWVKNRNKGERQLRVYTERGYVVTRATYRNPYSGEKSVHEFTPISETNYLDYLDLLIEHRQLQIDNAIDAVEHAKKELAELTA